MQINTNRIVNWISGILTPHTASTTEAIGINPVWLIDVQMQKFCCNQFLGERQKSITNTS